MKSFAVAVIIISLITAFAIGGTLFIDLNFAKIYTNVNNLPSSDDYSAVYSCAEEIEKDFKHTHAYLSIILSNEMLGKIEDYINEIKLYAVLENSDGIEISKSRLKSHIEQLRRLSSFNIESIF